MFAQYNDPAMQEAISEITNALAVGKFSQVCQQQVLAVISSHPAWVEWLERNEVPEEASKLDILLGVLALIQAGTISGDRNQAEQFIALFFLNPAEFAIWDSPVTEYTKAVKTALAALKHRAEQVSTDHL